MSFSTAVTDPPALSQPQRPSVHSSDAPIDDTPPPPYDDAYEGLNWGRIPGYIRPNNTSDRRGWYWEHGFEVQKGTDEKNRFWLCKSCHQKKPHKSYSFASRGVENIKNHMLKYHHLDKDGEPAAKRPKHAFFEPVGLNASNLRDQRIMNHYNSAFDPDQWKKRLLRWVIRDKIPFHKLESESFRDLCHERLKQLHAHQRAVYITASDPDAERKHTYDPVLANDTRWNSNKAEIERGLLLRMPIDIMIGAEVQAWQQYWNKITHNSTREPPARRREKPHIVDDALDDDDWHALTIYLEVLKPFEEATTRMQGNPGTASGSRIWDILPTQLWEAEYKHRVIPIPQERPPERRRIVVASGLSDFLDNLTCPVVQLEEERDEYDRYLARTDDPEDLACTDPITYWIGKRSVWPHLSQMALDILSIPCMSDEPERIFSLTGLLTPANRARLGGDIIGASLCLADWDRRGVIDLLK
ncbi:hypothetical protein FOFC_16028 [Fusarium oxysporum]|nr:hypothetical protein FOFC_16028 [Fusarium oxysporum]